MYQIIEALMKRKGVTAYRVAKDTGLTQAAFTRWKNGGEPNLQSVLKLSKYFEVPVEYFERGMKCTRQRRRSPGKPGCQSGQSGAGGKK